MCHNLSLPGAHETCTQFWLNVGPVWKTVGQLKASIGLTSCACWVNSVYMSEWIYSLRHCLHSLWRNRSATYTQCWEYDAQHCGLAWIQTSPSSHIESRLFRTLMMRTTLNSGTNPHYHAGLMFSHFLRLWAQDNTTLATYNFVSRICSIALSAQNKICVLFGNNTENKRRWPNVYFMLAHRLRRWTNT